MFVVKSAARVSDEMTAMVDLSYQPIFLKMGMLEIVVPHVVFRCEEQVR